MSFYTQVDQLQNGTIAEYPVILLSTMLPACVAGALGGGFRTGKL